MLIFIIKKSLTYFFCTVMWHQTVKAIWLNWKKKAGNYTPFSINLHGFNVQPEMKKLHTMTDQLHAIQNIIQMDRTTGENGKHSAISGIESFTHPGTSFTSSWVDWIDQPVTCPSKGEKYLRSGHTKTYVQTKALPLEWAEGASVSSSSQTKSQSVSAKV